MSRQTYPDDLSGEMLPLAVTCGDPAGVGPEVIGEALSEFSEKQAVCLLGPRSWAAPLAEKFGCGFRACGPRDFEVTPGNPSQLGASVALESMEMAAQGCLLGKFSGVVTGPISKHRLQAVGFAEPGQTEFFAKRWQGVPTMAFVGQQMRVVLATWHISLAEVPAALDAACLERAVTRAASLCHSLGLSDPRIGVCGLNPHAGECGILGSEEIDLLDPVLDRMREFIPGLSGCLPGDTVFMRQVRGEFDVVVALYHDQGLAPLKLLEFDHAVNLTLGLPYLRTSPDHGTGFEIAGQQKASSGSMLAALRLASRLVTKRT